MSEYPITICDLQPKPITGATHDDYLIEGKVNLGWICATVNSYSCIQFCFVYFKLCHIIFGRSKSRNWLTIFIYALIIIDLVTGCTVLSSIISQPDIYAEGTKRSSVPNLSIVCLIL